MKGGLCGGFRIGRAGSGFSRFGISRCKDDNDGSYEDYVTEFHDSIDV